jgi:hypothetical protein
MPDRSQPFDQFRQQVIWQYEWITTRKYYFFNRGVSGNGFQGTIPRRRPRRLAVRKMPPETVPAMDGTRPGHHQQGPPMVLMQ